MKISSVNTERTLMNIASSIGKSPSSWIDWYALYISLENIDKQMREDCLLWTRSIVESYLNCLEGHVFFCNKNGIHIICKSVQEDILSHAGSQICDLILHENNQHTEYNIYALATDGPAYAQTVLYKVKNVFQLPSELTYDERSNVRPKLESKKIHNLTEGRRVLLVEDDPVARWMVRNALKGECDLMTASYGNKVFTLYSSFQPHVVFLDINLPDQNGHELLEWITKNDPGAQVIMFSSDNSLQTMTSTFEQGAAGFISKPFLKSQLLEYVHN